ncbi:MAG: hypothetical protein R6T92_02490 [Desulfosalsimonadaceae bacterium]
MNPLWCLVKIYANKMPEIEKIEQKNCSAFLPQPGGVVGNLTATAIRAIQVAYAS